MRNEVLCTRDEVVTSLGLVHPSCGCPPGAAKVSAPPAPPAMPRHVMYQDAGSLGRDNFCVKRCHRRRSCSNSLFQALSLLLMPELICNLRVAHALSVGDIAIAMYV